MVNVSRERTIVATPVLNGKGTVKEMITEGDLSLSISVAVTSTSEDGDYKSDLKKAAENEYNLWNYSGYEGNITGWLVPVVKAGRSVRLRDKERPEGVYYVTGVEIEFGQNGAKRKVTLGRRLG